MAQLDSVSQNTQDYFGNYRLIKSAQPVSLAATGNAVVALPFLGGGTGGTTQYVIRRITASVLSNIAGGTAPSAATANVSIGTTNDGGNLVASGQTLTNLTASNTYQDLTLAAGTQTNTYTANALFVNVNTSVANAQCYITVYGDIQTF